MITGTLNSAPADTCCSPGVSAHFAFTIIITFQGRGQ
jgi:hypothetical protein